MFQGLPWPLWVKKRRKALDMTQAELARHISYSPEMIGRVERGLERPSVELATLLAHILAVASEERAEFVRSARLRTPGLPDVASPPPQYTRLRIPGAPAPPLIGRAGDLVRVQQALRRPAQRLVTITGPPGVGKTRLAIAVAQEWAATSLHPVVWVALAPLRDPVLVVDAVAQTLGVPETPGRPLLEGLQTALWAQPTLLVLDNCEQIPELSAVISDLLAAPGVYILATSRRRLQVRGEQQIPLGPLAVAAVTAQPVLDDLRTYPATELFLARVRDTAPDFALDAGNAAAVAQICAALDGLPLALELAAGRIRVLPPAAMLTRLHERLTWLVAGPRDLPLHQQTLAGTLAWSYNLLSPAQQGLFNRLAVFAGGFTLTAATAVCGTSGEGAPDLLSAVSELDEWNLLYRMGAPAAEPRYGMLETIHEYAVQCLEESGQATQLRHNHLRFFVACAEQAHATDPAAAAAAWRDRLQNEQTNFRAALAWGLSPPGDLAAAGRLAVALGEFWELQGYWQEARSWLARLLAPEKDPAGRLAARLRYYAGRFAYLQGDYAAAARLLDESLARSQAQEDLPTQIQALNTLGWIAYSQSDYRRAQQLYRQSLPLCRAVGDDQALATVLNTLGGITVELGDRSAGERLLQESLALRRAQGDQQGIARSLHLLGRAAQYRDDPATAQHLIAESADLFRAVGDKLGLALALNSLGWVCLMEGHADQAAIRLAEALDLAKEVGSLWSKTAALCYLGWTALQQGRPRKAAPLLRESLTLAQEHGIKQAMILCYLGLAGVALLTDEPGPAAAQLATAEQLRQEIGITLTPFERRVAAELQQAVQEQSLPHPLQG